MPQHQDKGGFEQFGGLNGHTDERELQPALCTEFCNAEKIDTDQQQYRRPVEKGNQPPQRSPRNEKKYEKYYETESNIKEFFSKKSRAYLFYKSQRDENKRQNKKNEEKVEVC
jgi:hypothetical protein